MSDMSYKELYLTQSPMIVSPDDKSDPVSNIFGVPLIQLIRISQDVVLVQM